MEQDDINGDRVLVGVDGSPSSIGALRYAARIAAAFGAPLEAATTWSYPPFVDYAAVSGWSPERTAVEILDAAVERAFDGTPPEGLVRTILSGPPASVLVEQSRRAGMLVLGSRGRGGFAGLLLGSVSQTCAEHAHCPVLIVHSAKAEQGPVGVEACSGTA